MDAFSAYIKAQEGINRIYFVSAAPGPVLLIWGNLNQCIVKGMSLIKEKGRPKKTQELRLLVQALKNSGIRMPYLAVLYDGKTKSFVINGRGYSPEEAAKIIAETFQINLGTTPA